MLGVGAGSECGSESERLWTSTSCVTKDLSAGVATLAGSLAFIEEHPAQCTSLSEAEPALYGRCCADVVETSATACHTLGWEPFDNKSAVCVRSIEGEDLNGCKLATYAQAKETCEAQGARLCTSAELSSNPRASTGNCSLEFENVWTSTACSDPSSMVAQGGSLLGHFAYLPACAHVERTQAGVLCCADVEPCMCANGGACNLQDDGLLGCVCPRGFEGPTCEEIGDMCDPNPCENGGTCTSQQRVFTCACVPPYTGEKCSDLSDPCHANPCGSFGECTSNPANQTYTCECQPGMMGPDCQTSDPCYPDNPCQNGGTCQAPDAEDGQPFGESRYECKCTQNWDPLLDCKVEKTPCSGNPCSPGQTCSEFGGGFLCGCPANYATRDCSLKLTTLRQQRPSSVTIPVNSTSLQMYQPTSALADLVFMMQASEATRIYASPSSSDVTFMTAPSAGSNSWESRQERGGSIFVIPAPTIPDTFYSIDQNPVMLMTLTAPATRPNNVRLAVHEQSLLGDVSPLAAARDTSTFIEPFKQMVQVEEGVYDFFRVSLFKYRQARLSFEASSGDRIMVYLSASQLLPTASSQPSPVVYEMIGSGFINLPRRGILQADGTITGDFMYMGISLSGPRVAVGRIAAMGGGGRGEGARILRFSRKRMYRSAVSARCPRTSHTTPHAHSGDSCKGAPH